LPHGIAQSLTRQIDSKHLKEKISKKNYTGLNRSTLEDKKKIRDSLSSLLFPLTKEKGKNNLYLGSQRELALTEKSHTSD